ncbi:PspA-associated protein PspAA [Dactylosporangium darangshiense]|uniref:PspA-associated domain-containing protein n=1 Tax=Dactylosporangium darangshiense TaxID=579108 RepID=A0ABP8DTH2_9ACTN
MITRILGEGQYDVPETALTDLNVLDAAVQAAVDAADTVAFHARLGELLAAVRERGTPVPDDVLTVSDLVLPAPDSDLADVAALLGDEGLIPG